MHPPRASSADQPATAQTVVQIAQQIEEFLALHPEAAVLEDGKVMFDLRSAKAALNTEHERCTLHLWSEERNLVRQIVSVTERSETLRLATQRFGHTQTKLLELVASRERRTPTTRETARQRYVHTLERMLTREFGDWSCEGFRTAMDLERSFGPAYARGSLVRGAAAWAVIGVNEQESASTIDGILTLGILWLDHCREHAGGRRLYQGLKVIVPRGAATLTLSRMAWLNDEAAKWELWELEQSSEELTQRDANDQGNLRTRLIHLPDEQAARERFAAGIEQVMQLVPANEHDRVEQRLRNTAELAFLLHGLEFARIRIGLAPNSFAQTFEVTAGVGANETPLTAENRAQLAEMVAELFARRRAAEPSGVFARRPAPTLRRIGSPMTASAHARMQGRPRGGVGTAAQDPLYRAAPERWLESMLRQDLAPLTRSLAPHPQPSQQASGERFDSEMDPDSIGNRADTAPSAREADGNQMLPAVAESLVIPRLDAQHVYSQVPAIVGAGDHGLLDLLGVTADGRLAVIELKVDDDLHFVMQGLDYWIRVRQHHLQTADTATGLGEFQRHGYFRGVELSPLPPRLYLVAPSLHIHPATETLLRYLSPRVEWNLLALDERWRQQIRVVWRKQSGR
ncbi:MAG: hypothetical protein ABR971_09865 [Acidobacteriaceae bacterium]|jgi:hypothetical protein